MSSNKLWILMAVAVSALLASLLWWWSSGSPSSSVFTSSDHLLIDQRPTPSKTASFFAGDVVSLEWVFPAIDIQGKAQRQADGTWNDGIDPSRIHRFLNDLSTLTWDGQRQPGTDTPDATLTLATQDRRLSYVLQGSILFHNHRSTNISGQRLMRFLYEDPQSLFNTLEDENLCPSPITSILKDSKHHFQVSQDWLREFCRVRVEHLFARSMPAARPVAVWSLENKGPPVIIQQHLEANIFSREFNGKYRIFYSQELQQGLNQLKPL